MQETIRALEAQASKRVGEIIKQAGEGTALIEYSSTFIPEELIRAAGANTHLMCRGGDLEAADAANDYLLRFMNPLARAMVGYLELGLDEVTPKADLLVTAQTDNHIGRTSEMLEFRGVKVCKVGVPANWTKESAFDYYVKSLRKMLRQIEETTGQAADMAKAREYFAQSNRINACFRRINELRRGECVPIRFEDYMRLQHLSFTLGDPELMIKKLDEICRQLESAPAAFSADAPRLLVIGRAIAVGDYSVFRLLDKSGGAVVAEILDECVRVTERDVELDGDLVHNFAKNRYKDKLPIDIFQPSWTVRFERMKELIASYRIDGVVWYQLAFDEIYDMEYSCVSSWMRDLGLPLLKIETNYAYMPEALGAITTRVESFVESLRD